MKWDETVASKCRYGGVAARIFGNAEIIYEDSEDDYAGYANVFAVMPDGTYATYAWTYGSCSGCDEWEARELSADEIEAEMRNATAFFSSRETARRFLHLETDAAIPSSNTVTNGSIPGMLFLGLGGYASRFNQMAAAVEQWFNDNPEEAKE